MPLWYYRSIWAPRILWTVVVLVVLAALTVGGVFGYARWQYDRIHKVTVHNLVAPTRLGAAPHKGGTSTTLPAVSGTPFNVLLIGSDSRAFVDNSSQGAAFGTGSQVTGQRSDVIIIARVFPATGQVTLLSIPRDLWVTIPADGNNGSYQAKINAAFNSGPSLLVATIESDLHIPITHYAEINFAGFSSMVDAVGGLYLNFPMPVRDAYSGLNVTQTGCQAVNGTTALALVRSRHLEYEQNGYWQGDGLSDFSRIQRQDVFFRALATRASGSVGDPLSASSFANSLVGNLTIDSTWSESDLADLAWAFHTSTPANLAVETLPTTGFTTSDGQDALAQAQPYAQDMITTFVNSTTGVGSTTVGPSATTTTTTLPGMGTTTTTWPGAGSTSTTTTDPQAPSGVYTNTQPEPWNPTVCTAAQVGTGG